MKRVAGVWALAGCLLGGALTSCAVPGNAPLRTDTTYIQQVVDQAQIQAEKDKLEGAVQQLKTLLVPLKQQPPLKPSASLLKAYYRLMLYQQKLGRIADAHQTGKQGLLLAVHAPLYKWTSGLYALMAYVASTEGDYGEAVMLAERSAVIGLQIQNTYCVANGYYEKAKALRHLERLTESQQAIEKAIEVGENAPGQTDLDLHYAVKASLLQRQKRYSETEFWYQRAIQLNQTANLASHYNDLGFFYNVTDQYDRAIQSLIKAIQLKPEPSLRAVAFDNLGVAYQKKGETIRAVQTLQKAIQALIPAYQPRHLNQWPSAQLIRMASNKEFLLPIFQNLARTWLLAEHPKTFPKAAYYARHTYTLADQLVDYMRWEHTGQQSKLYWREKTHELYEGAIQTCLRLNDPRMAYHFMEKSRAVLLTDQLNELGARQQLPRELAEQEARLNETIAHLQNKLAQTPSRTAQYQTLLNKLLLAQNQADRFVQQMATTHPLYHRYRYDNRVQPLGTVQQWLQKHRQSLVSYFVGDSALYVLGVTPTTHQLLRQPIAAYRQQVQPWLHLLQNPASLNSQFGKFVQRGHQLYRLLLEPLKLPEGRVVVSPDGFFLPLEALSRSATAPDYLVQQYAFSYVYSVNRMLTTPTTGRGDGSFLGMAPVQFSQSSAQAALPGSAESLERLSSHFFMPTLLTKSAATRAQFRRLAPQASVVQLFTHADADTLQREPVLYFSDSLLRMSELQTGPTFQTQLLVLSACRTGVGSLQRGEGVFSLARGFAALGVPSMLTTLWQVDNTPTYALTEKFYQYLAEGMEKDLALQRAKTEWLRSVDKSEQLPSTWAGLILLGDSQPIRPANPTIAGLSGWIGGGGLLLLLVLFWRLFRKPNRSTKIGTFAPQAGNWKPSLN